MYYKAIASGNADTLAIWNIWNGSAWVAAASLPSTSDDVYTNSFIVTVTTSQSYLSWNRSSVGAPYNIIQGGQFQIDGANEITLVGQVNGTNVNQSANLPTSACISRLSTHTNTLHRVGDDVGGISSFSYGFWNGSTYDIDLIGNQRGGSGSSSFGFFNNAAATFVSIVGNQQGSSGGSSYGFYNNAAAIFSNPIVGNQTANPASGFYNNAANINIPFQGNAYASNVSAIFNNQDDTSTIIYEGNIYNNLGVMAIRSGRLFLKVTPTTVWEFSDFDGDAQYLYGAGDNTGMPPEDKVEDGYIYGANDEFEGTLVQPPFTIADFIAALKADDLGIRLGRCATTEEVDSTVAAYNT